MSQSNNFSENLTLILAISQNGVLGHDNQLPWRSPEDLQHFRSLTLHKPILMGRKTWESLPNPLPHRQHWVLSSTLTPHPLYHLLRNPFPLPHPHPIIIGGKEIFQLYLPHASTIHLTIVLQDYPILPTTTHWPEALLLPQQWRITEERVSQPSHPYPPLRFLTLLKPS